MKPYGKELILDLHECEPATFNRDSIGLFFSELCDLIDLLSIPQMRRSVMAEFDQLKIIFKSLVDEHYTDKRKVLNE